MKISIIGGGNMGGAIAIGLAGGNKIKAADITIIDHNQSKIDSIKQVAEGIHAVVNDYTSISSANIIILAVKPWMIETLLSSIKPDMNKQQIIVSVAAGISLCELAQWSFAEAPIYQIIPNTAIAVKQSMTFLTAINTTDDQDKLLLDIFNELGKAILIDEKMIPGATALASCGIAFAFRYIRAAMEGGVEVGIRSDLSRDIVLQTLRGAIDLLEANGTHPEVEIDKVTTAGGITIKGLNEMEHAGFSSAVIKGLKACCTK